MSAAPPAAAVQQNQFRRTAGRLPTGVTVVATVVDGQPHAMTVNSFTTVSLDPLLVLVCIRLGSRMQRLLARSAGFTVNVLDASGTAISRRFADPRRPEGAASFDGVRWTPAPVTGNPLLTDTVAHLECLAGPVYPGGDHTIHLGEVVSWAHDQERTPLIFLDGRYTAPDVEHRPLAGIVQQRP